MSVSQQDGPGPCVMVVFGGSGDLMRRKIMPALYNLQREDLLPERTVVVGFGRSEFTDEAFREHLRENAEEFSRSPIEREVWGEVARRTFYHQGCYDEPECFAELARRLEALDAEFEVGGSRLFYMAVPPQVTFDVLQSLDEAGLIGRTLRERPGYRRMVLEKPFGRNLESARRLNEALDVRLEESQIFRMDHYLGKETVQNLLVLRFANSIFEPVWNNKHVKHVHVTVAETIGVEERAGYFEKTGALRDVLQNHVLQLLALFTMEPPSSLEPDAIRDEKAKLLRSLRLPEGGDLHCSIVRGQYGAGRIDGEAVPAYRGEQGVDPDSDTETFVALRTYIDNWRWSGVPFYLATGKRLAEHMTEVAVELREVPNVLFRAGGAENLETNLLKVRVQPDETVSLRICSKVPGMSMKIRPEEMEFPYGSVYGSATPEAYERLILDVMAGNATLFTRRDEIELAWRFVQPILDHWAEREAPDFPNYTAGTWGPISGEDFFREDTCYTDAQRD